MTIPNCDSGPLQWQLSTQLQIAYSTAADGDQRKESLRYAWLANLTKHRCVIPKQIHGSLIVDADDNERLAHADGVITKRSDLVIGVFGADCPGLIIDAGDVIGAAHCGWRGVAAGIVNKLIKALGAESQNNISSWHALIGPGISASRYEVDEPVLRAREWPSLAVQATTPGHATLDITHTIAYDVQQAGLINIQHTGICTANDTRLWSFRHQGPGLVQALVAWRNN